jgi:predicted MFS family arabinose efflux permease
MADVPLRAELPRGVLRRAIPTLGFTQMTAWGTTYYLPAVFREQFSAELGLSTPTVFAGVAVMLIASALAAWPAGRLMDRHGAGRLMPIGSACLALGLSLLASASGVVLYMAAWFCFGIGMTLCMGNAAFAALAQIAGQEARRAIVLLMLMGGMASTVFWPLALWLEGLFGWRGTCLVFAAAHAFVCLPLHALILAGATSRERRRDLVGDEQDGLIPPERRLLAGGLIAFAFASGGSVSWGLDLHLIAILGDFGLGIGAAVTLAALKGPATLLARLTDVLAGPRLSPMTSVLVASAFTTTSLALALIFGAGAAAATIFVVLFSFGTGLTAVARATLPLHLLGSRGYATTMGKLALPTQAMFAVSPMTFGLLLEKIGTPGAIAIGLAGSLVSLAALLALARLAPRAAR